MAVFALQQAFCLGALRLGNKRHRLLRREGDLKRAVVCRQPEGQFGALRGIPPVTGQ